MPEFATIAASTWLASQATVEIIAPAGTNDATADSSAIQAELDALPAGGTLKLHRGTAYRLNVEVPAGKTLDGTGAIVRPGPSATSKYIVRSGGVGARIVNVDFQFDVAEVALTGNEAAVRIAHAGVAVEGCKFTGSGYRYGVLIQHASIGSCDDARIIGNRFSGTSYGVLKQLATGTTANNLRIEGNDFFAIKRGDAIEINQGSDVGLVICDNVIDGVTANGIANAGFGIGVAGTGPYSAITEGSAQQDCRIQNNTIRNVEVESIHMEMCSRFIVSDNHIAQRTSPGTGAGIVLYGCIGGEVIGNDVRDCDRGIYDDSGVDGGSYSVSSTDNVIADNVVRRCTWGISSGATGENVRTVVRENTIFGGTIGMRVVGGAAFYLFRNTVLDATTPFLFDLAPSGKAPVNAVYTRILHVEGNRAYKNGLPQPLDNTLTNVAGHLVVDRDNNFVLTSAGDTSIYDWHKPGDIVIDGGTVKVCSAAGWTRLAATPHFFSGVAGNSYVRDHTGDPATQFKVGQAISLPGAGTAGGTLVAYIRRMYIDSGSSEYRILLSTPVVTTVTTPATISLAQTASYIDVS